MYNESPLIKRQWEILREANTIITIYEQGIAELEAKLAHEMEEAKQNYRYIEEECSKRVPQVELWTNKTEILAQKYLLKSGTPQIRPSIEQSSIAKIDYYINVAGEEYSLLENASSENTGDDWLATILFGLGLICLIGTFTALYGITNSNTYGVIGLSLSTNIIILVLSLMLGIFLSSRGIAIRRRIRTELRNHYATILFALSIAKTFIQEQLSKAPIDFDRQLNGSKQKAEVYRERSKQKYIETFTSLNNDIANYIRSTGLPGADWQDASSQLTMPSTSPNIIRCGKITVSYHQQHTQPFPFFIPFPAGQSVLLQASRDSYEQAEMFLQSLLLRLVTTQAPGTVRFTFFDPLHFGQHIAPFMQISAYDSTLVGNRIWTESSHIEQQLVTLSEYLAQVNQQYLWGATPTIEAYNQQHPQKPLPYRMLVVLGFPFKFSAEAVRTLLTIVRNGPRCGVYAVILCDMEQLALSGITLEDLNQSALTLRWEGQQVYWHGIQSELQAHSVFAL